MVSRERLKGLNFIRIGIIIYVIVFIINLLLYFILLNQPINPAEAVGSLCFLGIFSLFGFGTAVASRVLFIMGTSSLKKDAEKIGGQYKKDVKWAYICSWICLILFFVPFTYGFLWGMRVTDIDTFMIRNSFITFLSITVGWASRIALILIIVLSIRMISDRRQQNLVYLFAVIGTLAGILNFLFLLISQLAGLKYYNIPLIMVTRNLIPQIIFLGLFIAVYIAYKETIRINKGEPASKKSKNDPFSAVFPKFKQYNKALNKPRSLIAAFVIFGLILGATFGLWNYYSYQNLFSGSGGGGDDSELFFNMDDETTTESTSMDGHLDEQTSETREVRIGYVLVYNIDITLTWMDEPDQNRYENMPDTFTLTAVIFDDSGGSRDREETGTNERNSEGSISVHFSYHESNPVILDSLELTISLDEAGDYEPWIGPGLIKRTDTGNDYEITVTVEYQTEESSE